jgi:hypothetical protein
MKAAEPGWKTALYIVAGIVLMPAFIVGAPLYLIYKLLHAYYESPTMRIAKARSSTGKLYERAHSIASAFPSSQTFIETVLEEVVRERELPTVSLLDTMAGVCGAIYREEKLDLDALTAPPLPDSLEGARYRDNLISYIERSQDRDLIMVAQACIIECLKDFLDALPPAAFSDEDGEDAHFSISLGEMLLHPAKPVEALIFPFYSRSAFEHDLFKSLREQLDRNLCAVSGLPFSNQNRESPKLVTPKSYKGDDLVLSYLRDTPFVHLFSARLPFHIPQEARSRHQWIVGAPGAGKTTFISAMIADDLLKVARNEASIFVMDSQNELIPDIANLEMFAPGQPLYGKLIYLEPDPDYPLALNIFDTDKSRSESLSPKERAMIESGAIWMVEFFLSSLVKSDASPHQDTFLNYVIPALMAIPDATIFTFKDLLENAKTKGGESGYDRYKQHFGGLRKDTQDWLRDRMHSVELSQTRNAIRTRLDGFTARGFFHDMFMHPRNKFDLFAELQTSKVVLVSTMKGLLKNGAEPFGRYFIARLLQAAEERMFLAPGKRLPVYAYIDEASDYIAEEQNIEELINKARKQNVALIIANQMESQIASPIVRDALRRVAIQCRGEPGDRQPVWEIAIGNKDAVKIEVPNVNFAKMPRMSRADHKLIMADMHERFSSAVGDEPVPLHEQPGSRKRESSSLTRERQGSDDRGKDDF